MGLWRLWGLWGQLWRLQRLWRLRALLSPSPSATSDPGELQERPRHIPTRQRLKEGHPSGPAGRQSCDASCPLRAPLCRLPAALESLQELLPAPSTAPAGLPLPRLGRCSTGLCPWPGDTGSPWAGPRSSANSLLPSHGNKSWLALQCSLRSPLVFAPHPIPRAQGGLQGGSAQPHSHKSQENTGQLPGLLLPVLGHPALCRRVPPSQALLSSLDKASPPLPARLLPTLGSCSDAPQEPRATLPGPFPLWTFPKGCLEPH